MVPETRIERLDQIERHLAHTPAGCTSGELARMFGVSTDTIRRDLDLLESRGTALVKHGRRYQLDHRRTLHTVKLTNDEMLSLYLAARLLSRHSDEHNPHVVIALEKLADALLFTSPLMARHVAQAAAAVRQRHVRRAYVNVLQALTHAWVEGRKVRLRYRSYTKDERTERTFAPYFIEPSGINYACYVIGHDDLRQTLRTFKIERILEAELTDERYTIPPDFDPQHLLASAWGVIWRDKDDIEVQLHFAASVSRIVKESVWHHSQRVEDLPDGSCLFTIRIGSTIELKPWIRQWGAAVEVLTPHDLRAEIAAEMQEIGQLYQLDLSLSPTKEQTTDV